MKKIFVSGLTNIETTTAVRGFPISYYPIDYTFFGVNSNAAGVGYNLCCSFSALGDDVTLFSYLGSDDEGERILKHLKEKNISAEHLLMTLKSTPASVILFDPSGRRQIYCDLKDIQEQRFPADKPSLRQAVAESDLVCAYNINFNRPLLQLAGQLHKTIATDVHVLSSIDDEYNRDFMEAADILFLSDEKLPCAPEEFIRQLAGRFKSRIIIIGMGSKGALLFDREQHILQQMPAVPNPHVVNTVGAGDALYSSFLHFYIKGFSSVEALRCAQTFASVKIGFNGASVGFPTEEKILSMLRS